MTMTEKPNDLLLLAAKILTIIMQVAISFAGVFMLLAIPLMLVFQGYISAEIAKEAGEAVGAFPAWTIAGLFGLIVALLSLGFVFFGKLRAIVSTVGNGDPFAPENADRLNMMGWLTLGTQVILIPIAGLALFVADWAEPLEDTNIAIETGFDIEGILLAIILFILARVFKHGAAMREDLEGTV